MIKDSCLIIRSANEDILKKAIDNIGNKYLYIDLISNKYIEDAIVECKKK